MLKLLTFLVAFAEIIRVQNGSVLSAPQAVTSVASPLLQSPSPLPTPSQPQTQLRPPRRRSSLSQITSVPGSSISNVSTVLFNSSGFNLLPAATTMILSSVLPLPATVTADQTPSFIPELPFSSINMAGQIEPPDITIAPVVPPFISQILPPTPSFNIAPSIIIQPDITITQMPSQQIDQPTADILPVATAAAPDPIQQPQGGNGPNSPSVYALTVTGSDDDQNVATVYETSTVRRVPVPTAAGKGISLRANRRTILAVMVIALFALVG